jgi:diguanylate cyclase (GGDEF)-like protein/PAS domain S-box-containing protein
MGLISGNKHLLQGKMWSIRHKILFSNLLQAALLLALCVVAFFLGMGQYKQTLEEELDAAGSGIASLVETALDSAVSLFIHQVIEQARHQVIQVYSSYERSVAIKAEAKQAAIQMLGAQRVGSAGYLMAFDAQGVVHFHPDKALIGKDILQAEAYRDLWQVFKKQMDEKSEHVVNADFPSSGTPPQSRYLALAYCKHLDWFIAVVWHRQEIVRLIDLRNLDQVMGKVHYGLSSTAFLLDDQGDLVAHPSLKQQGKVAAFTTAIKALPAWSSLDSPQTARVQWQDAPGQATVEQLIYLHRLPRYTLTLGITADADQVFADYDRLRVLGLIGLLVGVVLAVGGVIMQVAWIATPLQRFLNRLPQPAPGMEGASSSESAVLTHVLSVLEGSAQQRDSANEKLAAEMQRRKSAEAFLQMYKRIFDSASEGMVITDSSGRILAINEAFTGITGYKPAEVIGQNPRLLKSGQHGPDFYERMWQALAEQGSWEGEIWNRKKDGTVYPEWLMINCMRNEQLQIVHYFASFYEIGELKKREKQIAFMAYHDILTRLPNRSHLEQRLARSLARIKNEGGKLAVLYIDLDNFKNINDVFGHKHGDDLLVQVSQRLGAVVSGNDILCRIGGDEFVLLLEQVDNDSLIYLTANRIIAALRKPFVLEFKTMYVNASIGTAVYPGDGETALDLVRSADMAMHKAKQEGKNRHVQFTKDMHGELYEKLRIENGIRYGLLHREFVVYYQPKVKTHTRRTSSLEALIRWNKAGKMISPGVFIPIAEESSLIDELCLFVLHETCAFHTTMQQRGVAVPVSVNISPRQFHSLDFVDIVEDLIGRYQMDPHYLEFEITETTAMHNVEHTLTIMHRLRELGIFFSIDDFGTGYSSLGSLSKMPVHTLKIDKQFVDDLETNSGIVATIIAISQQMHLNVVAEGVETEEQLFRLDAMGCHEVQGYYFSRPISGDDILQYLLAEREPALTGPAR